MTSIAVQKHHELISEWWERAALVHDYYFDPVAREIWVGGIQATATDEELGVDHCMARLFISNLRMLDSANQEPILVHLATVGGVWEYGMAMYDAIAACGSPVVTLSYGHAKSMSSIIPQAADYRVLTPHCLFMIHFGEAEFAGTSKAAVTHAKELERANAQMMDIYTGVCHGGRLFRGSKLHTIRKYLQAKMDEKEDWYMTAREAVDYGFADAVLGDPGWETVEDLRYE